MKVLITSDAHGNAKIYDRIISKNQDVDLHVDLGDFLLDYQDYPNTVFVRGNRDTWSPKDEEMITTIDGVKILFLHGHNQKVKGGLRALYAYAHKKNVDACYYGHTHTKSKHAIRKIMFVCPGAVKEGDYIILKDDIIKFHNIDEEESN